jgi:hypothetical protein
VRSGDLTAGRLVGRLQLPPLWEGEARPYVQSRYALCYPGIRGFVDPSLAMDLLLAQAQDLLRGKEPKAEGVFISADGRCSEVTTEEARALEQILSDAGWVGFVTPEWKDAFGDTVGVEVWFTMYLDPLLPHELSG